ncbi:MAG: VOC family protein [Novosphingobium sp.]|nr:VOC family protein [Novosphingobium sp.]
MKMNHVGISVSNIENTLAFYREMFGMEEMTPVFPFGGPDFSAIMGVENATGRMTMICKDDVRLEIFEFATPKPAPRDPNYPVADHGYSHFGFDVEDIDEVHDKLKAAGVPIHCPVVDFPGGIRAIYARDPDGYVFEVLQMPVPADAAG